MLHPGGTRVVSEARILRPDGTLAATARGSFVPNRSSPGGLTAAPGGGRLRTGRWRSVPTCAEPDPLVGPAGRGVVVVDVEADDRGDVRRGPARRPRRCRPCPAPGRAATGRPRRPGPGSTRRVAAPISALNSTAPSSIRAKARRWRDQLGDPRPVERAAVAGQRRDADLLGEHRDAGRQQHVELVRPDRPHRGVGRHGGGPSMASSGWRGAHLAGRSPARLEQLPTAGRPRRRPTIDEQRRPWRRARSANAAHGLGPACTGTRLAPGVAERLAAGRASPKPHTSAPSRQRVEPARLHPGGDEHVRDRVAVEQRERPRRGRARRAPRADDVRSTARA